MILAIDQGTTGTTCIVFDEQGRPRGRSYREFEQHFPRPGWVEHDATEIWEVTRAVVRHDHAGAGERGLDSRQSGGQPIGFVTGGNDHPYARDFR